MEQYIILTDREIIINKLKLNNKMFVSFIKIYLYKQLLWAKELKQYLISLCFWKWELEIQPLQNFIQEVISKINQWYFIINNKEIYDDEIFIQEVFFDKSIIESDKVFWWVLNVLQIDWFDLNIQENTFSNEYQILMNKIKELLLLEYNKISIMLNDTKLKKIVNECSKALLEQLK